MLFTVVAHDQLYQQQTRQLPTNLNQHRVKTLKASSDYIAFPLHLILLTISSFNYQNRRYVMNRFMHQFSRSRIAWWSIWPGNALLTDNTAAICITTSKCVLT